MKSLTSKAPYKIGPAARSFAADAHSCIMVPIPRGSTGYKVAAREHAPSGELPSDRHDEP